MTTLTPQRLDELLLHSSRTFALSIPRLPEPTRAEVTVAYLLFRIADTLEDATLWPRERQVQELGRFAALVRDVEPARAEALARAWAAQPPLAHAGYLELLGETPGVLAAYAGLAPGAREAVGRHTIRTAELMAAFVARKDDDGVLRLRDAADLAAYCYAVAGIVGEMLTELFLLDRAFLEPVAPLLRANAASFGEALQLVNILKDASADAREGRSFLPATLERGAVFARARGDLAAARDYVLALQRRGAPRGLIEFCALPVLLARATLERVEAHGPGAKLTRPEVAALVVQLDQDLSGGRPALS